MKWYGTVAWVQPVRRQLWQLQKLAWNETSTHAEDVEIPHGLPPLLTVLCVLSSQATELTKAFHMSKDASPSFQALPSGKARRHIMHKKWVQRIKVCVDKVHDTL
jgi:hypothetical protein